MKALVTGVAGFIGSHLGEALLERGAAVTGIDCFTDYYPRAVKERNLTDLVGRRGFRFVETSIQAADLDDLLGGVTHVFHLAAQAGVRKSWGRDFRTYTAQNIDATQILLDGCVGRPIERFVYASSSSVYGDEAAIPMQEDARPRPVSPYGVTKLAAEQLGYLYFVNYGVPVVSPRYFTVYGPRQRPDMAFHRFLTAARIGRSIQLYGDGEQTRDFTFVSDAVDATIACAERGVPGAVYNIGGGSRVSINAVLDIIARLAGRPLDVRREAAQKGDMRDTYADTARARRDLGFAPNTPLERGLEAEHRWISSGSKAARMPAGIEPDRYLAEQGAEALKERKWLTARQYYRQILDSYPQSPYRADAKLGVGDSYLGENTTPSYIQAINEFREFLTFYPTHPRADYAQYRLGMAYFAQMLNPQRDQTATKDAIEQFEIFVERYPNSALMPEARTKLREARDRLSESGYLVGLFYFRQRWYPGAIDRFKSILKDDPDYTGRDAVYFHLAEALLRTDRKAEALPYYEMLIKEFQQSEYLRDAWKRVAELKTENAVRTTG
jgi:outer membrane assembly lipoprotein YfiO